MKTEFDYTPVGDVYLPNLVSIVTNYEIGIWGQKHKDLRWQRIERNNAVDKAGAGTALG